MNDYSITIYYYISKILPTRDLISFSKVCTIFYDLFKEEWKKRLLTAHFRFYLLCSKEDSIVYYLLKKDVKERYNLIYALDCVKKDKKLKKFIAKELIKRKNFDITMIGSVKKLYEI